MARGRGRGSGGCLGKSSVRGDSAIRATMPSIPISTTISPQQGGLLDMRCKSSTKLITLQWKKVQDDCIECQHTSSPLGNGAVVETFDRRILVLQRSNKVGEFPGYFVFLEAIQRLLKRVEIQHQVRYI
ncbi:nudix hydrolase 9-like [Lycium ferocissimum]|uniref:nudix hydrolase 9-like n=1 Tax=Lycium ferocissimum TaxID=112874 RepID=UPI0028156B62|nr:nudix hydrolase 9-like [Lycium ferocissimum]